MKKAILLTGLVIVCVTFIIISGCHCHKKAIHITYSLPYEDTLNLSYNTVSVDSAIAKIKRGQSSVFYEDGKTPLNIIVEVISAKDLIMLYDYAFKILKQYHVRGITALRMHYSVDTLTKKFKMHYFPIFLKYDTDSVAADKMRFSIYKATAETDAHKFIYNSKGFVDDNSIYSIHLANYKNKIRIRHTPSGTPENYKEYDDIRGDVHKVTYSFQEIFLLLANNIYRSDSIYIINSADPIRLNDGTTMIKHTLLLSPGNFPSLISRLKKDTAMLALYTKSNEQDKLKIVNTEYQSDIIEAATTISAADVGSLCPPDCSKTIVAQ